MVIRENIDVDQLIDVIEGNKVYLPSVVVLNKIDMVGKEQVEKVKFKINPDLCISADKGTNVKVLKGLIFDKLALIRIYLKEYNKEADLEEPMLMWEGATLKDLCSKLHRDFVTKFKFARIWGKSVKFDGMKVKKLAHKIKDKDVIELRMN